MYVKKIICDVDPKLKHTFSIAQISWNEIKNCNGFIAQLGGWNSKEMNQAIIISYWESEETHNLFMNNLHDLIIEKSHQNKTYQKIKVTFEKSDIYEHDTMLSIQKNISTNHLLINLTKVNLESSWSVLSKKFY